MPHKIIKKWTTPFLFYWSASEQFTRKDWFRFCSWLAIMASLAVYLIASQYLSYIQVSQPHSIIYLISAYIGHFALFPVIGCLSLLPVALLLPYRQLVLPLSALILFLGFSLLVVDTQIYAQYRFHLSGFIWDMLTGPGAGEIIQLSWVTLLTTAFILVAIVFLTLLVLSGTTWCLQQPRLKGKGYALFSIWILALSSGHILHVWYEAHYDTEVTGITRHFPSYYPATGKRALVKRGWIDPDQIRPETALNTNTGNKGLKYPINPLQCSAPEQPKNVLVIALDAMRADTLTPEITPNLYRLSQQDNAQYFTDHFSGGNVTKGGIFTLFFGLPATYWDGFASAQQGALWIREHQRQGYAMGIFSSATLLSPAFDRTVFASVSDLRLKSEGSRPSERDKNAVQSFEQFIEHKPEQSPFFGFLFLDAIHGYDVPEGYEKFQPQWERVDHIKLNNDFDPEPYFNRYKNAAFFLDDQIGQLIDKLDHQGLLKETVVVITSDHGEEFNDLKQNFWGHGSNFTHHQSKAPLLILWPGKEKTRIDHRTSHYDLAPTIMTEVLGCTNPTSDYAVGHNLFKPSAERDWLIVHSYFNYGIVGKDRIIATYPTGNYEILDTENKTIKNETMPTQAGIQSIRQMSMFYQ